MQRPTPHLLTTTPYYHTQVMALFSQDACKQSHSYNYLVHMAGVVPGDVVAAVDRLSWFAPQPVRRFHSLVRLVRAVTVQPWLLVP
jgi:hypothetical protein